MEVPDTNGTIFPFPIDLLPTQFKIFKKILRVHAGAPSAQTASRSARTDRQTDGTLQKILTPCEPSIGKAPKGAIIFRFMRFSTHFEHCKYDSQSIENYNVEKILIFKVGVSWVVSSGELRKYVYLGFVNFSMLVLYAPIAEMQIYPLDQP